ncbi:helix-turn-helix domain-containing protein [Bacillus sp. FJAT-45350]|uniref:helix-turn-helix domain-containing protein n=1 Tax=Bacillus sp. FJAT-45350 TaxID=2011014 RepID=UPI000BB9B5F6|nr:helix-turn-helix domain-containing protein [Bacillus sp. FJAT-45350]
MAKYSEEFKLMVVIEYREGNLSYDRLANKHRMQHSSMIKRWVKVYERYGAAGLMKKTKRETYSVQFKLDVISFMKRTGSSEVETAIRFGLSTPSMVSSWKKVFWESGTEDLEKAKGRPPMSDKAKNKKVQPTEEKKMTYEQKLERENELLRLEVEYLKKLKAFQMDPEGYLEKHKQRYHSNSKKSSD